MYTPGAWVIINDILLFIKKKKKKYVLLFYFAYKLLVACAVKCIWHFYQHLGMDLVGGLGPQAQWKKKPRPKKFFFIGYIYIFW